MNVKNRIIELCHQKNISINKLAELSEITQSTLNSIMNSDDPNPQYKTIEKICRGLDVSMSDFYKSNDDITVYALDDLLQRILKRLPEVNIPAALKEDAADFCKLPCDIQKQLLTPLIKGVDLIKEDTVQYDIVGHKELLDKYKSLPEEHRKAIALIIDSLSSRPSFP